MGQGINKHLADLAGRTAWNKGLRAYRDGAVLDVSSSGKLVEARVANLSGRFERVVLRLKKGTVSSQCTCAWRATAFCEHAVAGLLKACPENPELADAVNSMGDADGSLGVAGDDAAPSAAAANVSVPLSSARVADKKRTGLRALLGGVGAAARLDIEIAGDAPDLESRWNRLEFRVNMVYGRRKFSASNMKRLIEVGTASGGMRLTDFSVQEQQFMRFLLTQAETVGTRHVLNSHDAADAFHCLVNFPYLTCAQGQITVHAEILSPRFLAEPENNHFIITPRFELPGHGLLPQKGLKTIVGRGGAWIGLGTDYWWLPGVTDAAWLRGLISEESLSLSAEDMDRLAAGCENARFPAKLMPAHERVELHATKGQCSPILTLDWVAVGISARLEFEYGGKRVDADGPPLIWEKKRFVSRDDKAEKKAERVLRRVGFTGYPGRQGMFILREPEKLHAFLEKGVDKLDTRWQVYYSNRFSANRRNSTDIRMAATTKAENHDWFELDLDLQTVDGELIPLEAVLKAMRDEDTFIQLKSGAVAKLPDGLRHSLDMLMGRTVAQTGNTVRFGSYAANAVDVALRPFSLTDGGRWRQLCDRLLQPVTTEGLHLTPRLESTLRDYQREGVAWMRLQEECGFHGILADEMGLGKTIQALSTLCRRRRTGESAGRASLVVCPTSLVENWLVEAEKFAPELQVGVIHGPDRAERLAAIDSFDLIITSYALLRRDTEEYGKYEFDYVILDEAQHIKNPETANAKTCKSLRSRHRLILTGTPIENSLHELWSLFDFLLPGMLGTRKRFREEFELQAANGLRADVARELSAMIRPFILRRSKKDVCSQLPPKIEQVMYCELSDLQRQMYRDILAASHQMLKQAKEEGFNNARFDLLGLLMRMRQICCHPALLPAALQPQIDEPLPSAKMDLLKEIIFQAIDSDSRMLIFSQFTGMLKLIRPWLEEQNIRYQYLDGSTKDRLKRVNDFNEDPSIPVFLISLKAGGTGLNLTGADTVIHYDQWWNPMVEDQATDRSHRIGQKKSVTSIKLVARNTVEEKILALQADKRELFNQLLAGAQTKLGELKPEDFDFLLS
ncbi:MAG: SNF2-related protein [Lentisphaeria bacterium]|nr:SNF2-related protein [Lentisphaeria bacterium]